MTLPPILRLLGFLCCLLPVWVQAQPASLEQTSTRARQLLEDGKFADAIPLLLELRQHAPDNTSLAMTLGQAYAATGDYQKAILEYDSVRRRLPQFKPALVSLATLYLNLGQVREGISLLNDFVGRNPGDADARSLLASAYAADGDLGRANEQLREIARLQPANPQAWFALHQNYRAIANESIARAEQANPESAGMVAMAGFERMELEQDESAFFLFREALRRDNALRGVHPAIAEIYTKREQEEWAKKETARESAMGKPDCAAEPAACAFLSGNAVDTIQATRFARLPEDLYWRYRAAMQLAKQAYAELQSLPASVQSHGARAENLRTLNRHADAVGAWKAAIALSPDNPGLQKELVVSLYQARDYEACVVAADQLLKIAPGDPELLLLRADASLNQQDAAGALPFLERAIQLEPEMLPARASLGRALLHLNRATEAIPHLESALPYAPDGSVLYQLSQAYQQAGRSQQAAQVLARYQEVLRREQNEKAEFEAKFQITPP